MTYNHAAYIENTLAGIDIQQTKFPFEIVIGDDFSEDNTLEKIKNYKFSNPNINIHILNRKVGDSYYEMRRKKGRLFNFVNILKNCSGKYIALLDGDDYWTDPFKLQNQVDFLEKNKEYGICYHEVLLYNENSQLLMKDNISRKIDDVSTILDLAKDNFIHTPSVVLRNNFEIPEWFFKLFLGDRGLYMLQIKDRKIRKLKGVMAVYRVHNSGVWSGKNQYVQSRKTVKDLEILYNRGCFNSDVQKVLLKRIQSYERSLSLPFRIKRKIKYFFKYHGFRY